MTLVLLNVSLLLAQVLAIFAHSYAVRIVTGKSPDRGDVAKTLPKILSDIECARQIASRGATDRCLAAYNPNQRLCLLVKPKISLFLLWERHQIIEKDLGWKILLREEDLNWIPPSPLMLWVLDRRFGYKTLGPNNYGWNIGLDAVDITPVHTLRYRKKGVAGFPMLMPAVDKPVPSSSLSSFSIFSLINTKSEFEVFGFKNENKSTILRIFGNSSGIGFDCKTTIHPNFFTIKSKLSGEKWTSLGVNFEQGYLKHFIYFDSENQSSGTKTFNKRCFDENSVIQFFSLGTTKIPRQTPQFGLACVAIFKEELTKQNMRKIADICL